MISDLFYEMKCAKCGGANLERVKRVRVKRGEDYVIRCKDCKKRFRVAYVRFEGKDYAA
jgi:uncharacterized Zn finger protein